MRLPAPAAGLLLAAALAPAPPAAACALAPGEPVRADLPVLHLELAADRTAYRRGEVATLRVAVTQLVADGPPVREAVTEVSMTVGARRLKRAGGSTDARGRLVLRFTVPAGAPLGRVRADASARTRLLVSAECEDLLSGSGRTTVDPLMTVRR